MRLFSTFSQSFDDLISIVLNVVVWFSFKGVFNCWIWSSSHTRVKIKNACIMPKREPGYYISIREDFLQQACSQFWHCQFWRQKVKEKYPTDWLNKAMELYCSNWHNMNIEDPPEFFWKCQCLVPKVVFWVSYVVHAFFWCTFEKIFFPSFLFLSRWKGEMCETHSAFRLQRLLRWLPFPQI